MNLLYYHMKKIKQYRTTLSNKLKLLASRALHDFFLSKVALMIFLGLNLLALDNVLKINFHNTRFNNSKLMAQESTQKQAPKTLKNKTNGSDSWWHEEYLSLYDSDLIKNLIDRKFSSQLAKKAYYRANRLKSKGNCMRAVKFDLWNILTKLERQKGGSFLDLNKVSCDPGNHPYKYRAGLSAEHFRIWAKENPISLYRELGLADVSNIPGLEIEKGFIFVYAKGQYGFHKTYGHIEVITNTKPLTGCSDHCRRIRKYKKPSLILAPIRNYAPLFNFEQQV